MDPLSAQSVENTVPKELSNESVMEIEIPYNLLQYLSTEERNLQNICRICLSVSEPVLYSLFESKDKRIILNMLLTISELQITENDDLPSNICKTCQKEIIDFYNFKTKCLKSDYTLKSILKGEFMMSKDTGCNNNINKENEEILTENYGNIVIDEDIKPADFPDIEYLQNIKDEMRDDEALCIVGDTKDNIRKITFINNIDPNNFQEMILQKQTKKKSKKLKHSCKFCPKTFNKVKSLRVHTNKRHADTTYPFPCDKCTESFHSEFDLGVHGMLHTPGPWTCSQCQKVFHAKPALRRHIQRHMQSKRFRCDACGKSFVELYALRRHSRVHTGERLEKKYACQLCEKRYSNRSALSTHEAQHVGARVVCAACGKGFASARLLASHRRVHSADKPHVCHHCGKGFRHESTRNTHLRTHTGERPFECALCGKTFIQRSNMTLHMRTHTGEKPYSCTFCDRRFSSGSTLKAHKRTHTGERPYSCKVCGKSFARLNMKLHMRLHTGERPHACSACHKRFTSAPRLRDHYRTHTGETPFECALCTDKFATKSNLIKHVRAHEKNKKSTKKGVLMEPVTVSDKSIHDTNKLENNPAEYVFVEQTPNIALNVAPNISSNLCTVQETPIQQAQELLYQDNGDLKAEVIVLGTEQNLITNGVTYVNDLNYSNDVKLLTVNEGEVSLTGSAVVEGTTVKLYQYDQSLLQIHSGAAHLTISRISSKMTTNF